jgi:hypothetical protein
MRKVRREVLEVGMWRGRVASLKGVELGVEEAGVLV